MKNIQRNKTKFQTFLETLNFIFHLFFGAFPQKKTQTRNFSMPVNHDRITLKRAVAAFELKKCGGAR